MDADVDVPAVPARAAAAAGAAERYGAIMTTWHEHVLPQVIAAAREEVGGVLTDEQLERVARACMAASITGIGSAVGAGLVPERRDIDGSA